MDGFVCTECGFYTEILFREYSKSVLKLHNCDKCSNPVDKYIEYDETVICMDVVLQKIPAYRHILYNSRFKAFWKLGVLSVIFTGYVKCNIGSEAIRTESRKKQHEFSFELDWNFYIACLQSAFEFAVYLVTILWVSFAFRSLGLTTGSHSYKKLIDGLMLANFGQILSLPTVIWNAEKMHRIYFYLTFLFVVLSNVQVYRAVSGERKLNSWFIILLGFSIKILTTKFVEEPFMEFWVTKSMSDLLKCCVDLEVAMYGDSTEINSSVEIHIKLINRFFKNKMAHEECEYFTNSTIRYWFSL